MIKATPEEMELHEQITVQNDVALSILFDVYGGKLIGALKAYYPDITRRDDSLIPEAVSDALFNYYLNPQTFNPEKKTLLGFLKMSARFDLLNNYEKRKKRKDLPDGVELEEKLRNTIVRSGDSADTAMITEELKIAIDKIFNECFFTERDIFLAKMVLSKERETARYSEVLEIQNELGISEQRIEVKKNKDRIKKVLERNNVEHRIKSLLHEYGT